MPLLRGFFDLAVDIRGFDQLENTWTVVLMSQDRATFEADVSEIPECFTVQLGMTDLREQPSGTLDSGEHLLTVKPGGTTSEVDGPSAVTIHLERGWNLISFPGELVDSSPQSVLGGSVMQILAGGGSVPETLKFGEGYWALAIAPTELEVILYPGTQYTRAVKRGWNLIGSVIFEVPMPEGMIQLASWNAKTQEYESPTTLLPTVGYWAFALEEGEITVSTAPPPAPGAPKASALETLWHITLELADAPASRTELEMGVAPQASSEYDRQFDSFLPPPAPDSYSPLKAGFLLENDDLLLQRSIISMAEAAETGWSLQISSCDSETLLHWNAKQIPAGLSLRPVDGNRWVDMTCASSYRVPPGGSEIRFVLRRESHQVKPSRSLLLQNFPNPFNPETWIPYQLADSGEVFLTIYDIDGRIVRNLPLGHKSAGVYLDKERAAYWDGRNDRGERVSSGVYFYRLKVDKPIGERNFTAVGKMVIVK